MMHPSFLLCFTKVQLQPLDIYAQAALGNRAVGTALLSNDVRQGEVDVISALYVMAS